MRSRVVRARSSTIAARPSPTMRLKRGRLPPVGGAGPAGGRGRRSERLAGDLARPDPRVAGPGDLQDPLGHELEVLDRRGRAAGDPDGGRVAEHRRVEEIPSVLDLQDRRPDNLAQAGQLPRVGAAPAANDHHEVDLPGRLHGVLLASNGYRADCVHDLELVGQVDHAGGKPLELPGRLRGLGDEGHPLPAGDAVPVGLLVDHDRVRRETQQPDDLGVVRRPQEHDRVAVLDELLELLLLGDDPRAGAIDDVEAAIGGGPPDRGRHAVGADHDGGPVEGLVERADRPDAAGVKARHDPLVVDDLAEGVGHPAGVGGLLRLVDRLADAIAEAGALRDADVLNRAHVPIIARFLTKPRWSRPLEARWRAQASPSPDAVGAPGPPRVPSSACAPVTLRSSPTAPSADPSRRGP
jgi:hypothetical protein